MPDPSKDQPEASQEQGGRLPPGCGAAVGAAGFTFAAVMASFVSVVPDLQQTWNVVCIALTLLAVLGWGAAAVGFFFGR